MVRRSLPKYVCRRFLQPASHFASFREGGELATRRVSTGQLQGIPEGARPPPGSSPST
jgi:hypothetical protein